MREHKRPKYGLVPLVQPRMRVVQVDVAAMPSIFMQQLLLLSRSSWRQPWCRPLQLDVREEVVVASPTWQLNWGVAAERCARAWHCSHSILPVPSRDFETVLFECTVLFYLDKERDPGMAPGNRGSVPPGIFKPVPSPHESFSGKESSYLPSRPRGCLRSKSDSSGDHFIVA